MQKKLRFTRVLVVVELRNIAVNDSDAKKAAGNSRVFVVTELAVRLQL